MKALYTCSAVAAIAWAVACGSTSVAPSTLQLQDEYEPVGSVSTGGITQITFDASGTYFLKRLNAPAADEILTSESGTFTLDASAGVLTLTPRNGTPTTHTFSVQLTGQSSTASFNGALHTEDFGSLIQFILSFILDGQTFHTDDTTTSVDDGGTDDAGWFDDASSDAGSSSCVVAPATPVTSSGGGLDVSHYQPNVDWSQVKTSRNFAFAKATEGTTYIDPLFSKHYAAIQSAGMKRGAYHFFRASKDPVKQADHFVDVLQANGFSAGADLAPVVDVEVPDGVAAATLVENLRAFVQEAQSKLGTTLMVYTGPSFWRSTLGNPDFSSNPLWIAHYTKAAHPSVPSTWSTYTIWQYSQTETITGISGGVDGDRWSGEAVATTNDGGSEGGTTVSCGDGGGNPTSDGGGNPSNDAGTDEGLIPGNCTHDVCVAGERLGQSCNSCTMTVCAHDPYCCDTYWGLSCFTDVQQYCGKTCN